MDRANIGPICFCEKVALKVVKLYTNMGEQFYGVAFKDSSKWDELTFEDMEDLEGWEIVRDPGRHNKPVMFEEFIEAREYMTEDLAEELKHNHVISLLVEDPLLKN